MREFLAEPPQLPLVFDNHGPTSVNAAQFSPPDVVESPAVTGTGLHLELSTAALHRHHDDTSLAGDDYAHGDHADHVAPNHYDEYDVDAGQSAGADLDDFTPRPCRYLDDDVDVDDDDRVARALLRRDHDERRRDRHLQRRKNPRATDSRVTRRHGSPSRPGTVDSSRVARGVDQPGMRFSLLRREHHSARRDESKVPIGHHHLDGSANHVDTPARPVRSFAAGPLQGGALALYFALLPYVVETKWRFSYTITSGALLRDLLVGLAIFWLVFLVLLVIYVNQLRHRRVLPANGCAWLAALVIMALPFLVSSSAQAATTLHHSPTDVAAQSATGSTEPTDPTATTVAPPSHQIVDNTVHEHPRGHGGHDPSPESPPQVQMITLALMVKGRRDQMRRSLATLHDDELDEVARLLSDPDVQLIAQLRDVVGSDRDGEVLATSSTFEVEARLDFDPVVVALIGERPGGLALGYAREGGRLPIDLNWSDDELKERIVALHDGNVTFAHGDNELMRALARRRDLSTIVVYLGDPADLDDELREFCVTVRAASGTVHYREPAVRDEREVRVELLRAYPQVGGIVDDFTPSLRRRCVEMVAYLAMHAGEPVTGDRLRTRVLLHANVDASKTTLTNTASSVRRALGSDVQGYLLEPVSSGLYQLRGVGLDVADFHLLVARSRRVTSDEAHDLYVEALRLVHGEPLASVLKGFEWFTFEGHRAQLQRDGEWVALALHDSALARNDVETAFWALRQGLLLDPDSDVLLDALERVPRLRQFGGDGASTAQHQAVRPDRAIAMSWAFERFGR